MSRMSHLNALLLALPSLAAAADLGLSLSSDGATFNVTLDGKSWLSGVEVMVDGNSYSGKSLVTVGSPQKNAGTDALGEFSETVVSWALSSAASDPVMMASYKTYAADKGVIVFSQTFPKTLGAGNMSDSDLNARTVFPGFSRNDLDCFTYHGVFPKMSGTSFKDYSDSKVGGSPLTLYDSKDSTLPMTVFSPLNYPLAHHMASSDDFVGAGVKATVTEIPAGWTQTFILSAGSGIKSGMMAWGDRMLKVTGRPRADPYLDDSHGKIGFWTDNGGFYHYSVGTNKSLGTTYEEVLPKVKAYHDELGVPFGHWQFDSWFYPKDGGVNPGGGGGAVTNWTADPSVFPSGMAYIQSKIGLPTIMHNRQWSTKSDYIKNEPFEWYTDKYAVPKDPDAFFAWFFKQQQGWGLSMYEQDWMCTEYDGVNVLRENITMGDLWLKGMADGAAGSGRTVQYCMPYPNQVLSAAWLPAVTNARATGDYFHAGDQWAVGATSLFYWAIGVLPFKDGFYSSNNKQVGGQTVGPEKNPDRETLMATMSTAMVGPMDGIYLLNKTRIMQTCMADGTVLRPDAPIHTSDACFMASEGANVASPEGCYVYYTYSDVEGLGRVGYYFNNDDDGKLTPAAVYLSSDDQGKYAVRNWYTGEVSMLSASNALAPGYEGHIYATVTPVIDGSDWLFFGEVDKYAVAAGKRFGKVTASGSDMTVSVNGVKGESVKVCAAKKSDLKTVCQTAEFKDATTVELKFE